VKSATLPQNAPKCERTGGESTERVEGTWELGKRGKGMIEKIGAGRFNLLPQSCVYQIRYVGLSTKFGFWLWSSIRSSYASP